MVFSDLLGLGRLLALEADPVAVVCAPGAEFGRHHRHAAGVTDRGALFVQQGAGVAQRFVRIGHVKQFITIDAIEPERATSRAW
jgi:hypothetical protein